MLKSRAQTHPDWSKVLRVLTQLQNAGHKAYFAGGCVRDLLLNRVPNDFDVATNATPDQVEALFSKTVPVGRDFGVMIVQEEGCAVEVATFRRDGDYLDGRRPESVSFSDDREDALRRDFTVNALFWNPSADQLIDHVGGIDDLRDQRLKTVGDPKKRFTEDKLRLLRAVRFSAQLGFSIDPETMKAVRALASSIGVVSVERIQHEIEKILLAKNADLGLGLLESTGLRAHALPEWLWCTSNAHLLRASKTLLAVSPHLKARLFVMSLAHMDFDPDDGDSPMMRSFERLRFSKDILRRLSLWNSSWNRLRKSGMQLASELSLSDVKEIFCGKEGLQFFEVISIWLAREGRDLKGLMSQMAPFCPGDELPQPWFGGDDLKKIGLTAGPKMGSILEELWRGQLDGRWQSQVEAQGWLKDLVARKK